MKEIPLFPLNIFLLPGSHTQLYIFEERYKQLVNHCVSSQSNFGIPFSSKLNGAKLGVEAQVVEVLKRYPRGEMDIIIKALDIFRLEKFLYKNQGSLYPAGLVNSFKLNDHPANSHLNTSFKAYLQQYKAQISDLLVRQNLSLFEIAGALEMTDLEKIEWVQLGETEAMQNYLLNYLRYLELLHEQESHLYQNIYLN